MYKIIPFLFIAFIATAVCFLTLSNVTFSFVLQIFSSLRDRAISLKPLDFSANSYSDSYRSHFTALRQLGEDSLRASLKLLKTIYTKAR